MILAGLVASGALVYGLVHTWVTRVSPTCHNALRDLLQLRQTFPPSQAKPP
jgi:hypothetical protein